MKSNNKNRQKVIYLLQIETTIEKTNIQFLPSGLQIDIIKINLYSPQCIGQVNLQLILAHLAGNAVQKRLLGKVFRPEKIRIRGTNCS